MAATEWQSLRGGHTSERYIVGETENAYRIGMELRFPDGDVRTSWIDAYRATKEDAVSTIRFLEDSTRHSYQEAVGRREQVGGFYGPQELGDAKLTPEMVRDLDRLSPKLAHVDWWADYSDDASVRMRGAAEIHAAYRAAEALAAKGPVQAEAASALWREAAPKEFNAFRGYVAPEKATLAWDMGELKERLAAFRDAPEQRAERIAEAVAKERGQWREKVEGLPRRGAAAELMHGAHWNIVRAKIMAGREDGEACKATARALIADARALRQGVAETAAPEREAVRQRGMRA